MIACCASEQVEDYSSQTVTSHLFAKPVPYQVCKEIAGDINNTAKPDYIFLEVLHTCIASWEMVKRRLSQQNGANEGVSLTLWYVLQRDTVTNICQAADKQLFTLVDWAKRIPHFSELPLDDQVILLRAGEYLWVVHGPGLK